MPGRYLTKAYLDKRNEDNDRPYRTSVTGGRRACYGGKHDPYPGTFDVKNCNGNRMNFRFSTTDGSNPPNTYPFEFMYEDRLNTTFLVTENMSEDYAESRSGGKYSLIRYREGFTMGINNSGFIVALAPVSANHSMFDENMWGLIVASPSEVSPIDDINWDLVKAGDVIEATLEGFETVTFKIEEIQYLAENITPVEIAYIKLYHVSGGPVEVPIGDDNPVTFKVTAGEVDPNPPVAPDVPVTYDFLYSDRRSLAILPGTDLSAAYSGTFGRWGISDGPITLTMEINSDGLIESTNQASYSFNRIDESATSFIFASPSESEPIEDINWDLAAVGDIITDSRTDNVFEITNIDYLSETITPIEIAVITVSHVSGTDQAIIPDTGGYNVTFTLTKA